VTLDPVAQRESRLPASFQLAVWALNRCGHYRAAASVTLAMFPLVIFALVTTATSADPRGTLSYLVLGILLANILLSWRGVAVLTVASLDAARIVEVHRGRIWIESEGRGRDTSVCFTLPGPRLPASAGGAGASSGDTPPA